MCSCHCESLGVNLEEIIGPAPSNPPKYPQPSPSTPELERGQLNREDADVIGKELESTETRIFPTTKPSKQGEDTLNEPGRWSTI
jgi:hypothetical protein